MSLHQFCNTKNCPQSHVGGVYLHLKPKQLMNMGQDSLNKRFAISHIGPRSRDKTLGLANELRPVLEARFFC